ncbi:ubiquinol-cytochrome C chaperone [Siccirubricoccus sp. KC 17139]|uniref:Ubiquinol-cytochrome C chaperone n=1 Tax=Siccirubricoccus soli TaxID=2899147 RepID=A0ABT1D6Z8_9PROT|nr:ubiquinol-cytochrome C chaperone family protein [Siccirubricoccus soli]MCO6417697.1 ubiquinol-cytochrome C chaperone [Siccirubricoccus soli]MCP2683832.1 ubiquinol-cytochrome C chaperone [Siccirubricoccus soli]
MGLFALFRRKPHERAGFELYGAAVAAARQPWFFARLGVPDTLDGRFDLVGLHVALLIRRLRTDADPRGPALAQAVFDAMFADMDLNLREMGVGDLAVGKRVKRMWEAFHGRAQAYEAAIAAGDATALAVALRRNVWRAEEAGPPPAEALALAAHAMRAAAALEGQGLAALLAGQAVFPPPEGVADAA